MSDHLEDILLRIEKLIREAVTRGYETPTITKDVPKTGKQTLADILGDDKYVKSNQAAEMIGVARGTLDKWYSVGDGPKALVHRGKRFGYRIGEIRRWIREHEQKRGTPP